MFARSRVGGGEQHADLFGGAEGGGEGEEVAGGGAALAGAGGGAFEIADGVEADLDAVAKRGVVDEGFDDRLAAVQFG
jgi:hypothetical protein